MILYFDATKKHDIFDEKIKKNHGKQLTQLTKSCIVYYIKYNVGLIERNQGNKIPKGPGKQKSTTRKGERI